VGDLERAPALPPPPAVDRCAAVLAYDGAGRELVARVKYRNARSALRWLASAMADLAPPDVDVVTWVPTSTHRRRARGFDQAELLARAIARRLRVPCRALLTRGAGPPQTGRSLAGRRAGTPMQARSRRVASNVLLVDDVVTTGTSVSMAAAALRRAGATTVSVVAAARTPLKRARSHPENCGQ
jgi:predicted amidophosphoribosyltransferase